MPHLFGAKLKYARHKCGITQSEFAERVGRNSYAHILRLESGKREPSLDLVIRSAWTLDVSLDYLIRDTVPVHTLMPLPTGLAPAEQALLSFGHRLQGIRTHQGYSQTAFAEALGVSRAFLSNIEASRKFPSLDLVIHMANLLDIRLDDLLLGALT